MSKEHIFADWLQEIFPRAATDTHTQGVLRWTREAGETEPEISHRQGHSGTRKARVVCETCNNGWLSGVENRIKPILLPMIRAHRLTVTPRMQEALAFWAVKTALVAEKIAPDRMVTPDSVYKFVYEKKIVPAGYSVYIAPYAGLSWAHLRLHQFLSVLNALPGRAPSEGGNYLQTTAMGLGHVFILVIGIVPTHSFWAPILGHMRCIHPAFGYGFTWPSDGVLFSDGLADKAATCASAGELRPVNVR